MKDRSKDDKPDRREARERHSRKMRLYTIIGFSLTLGAVMAVFFGVILPKTEKMHNHVYLSIVQDGMNVTIPADTGINTNPEYFKYHELDQFASKQGHSPLHTHGPGGLIHVESIEIREYTLGEFLLVGGWNFDNATSITLSSNGQVIAGKDNYKDHVLEDMERLVLQVTN